MPRGISNDGKPNAGWFKAGDLKLKIKTPEHRAAISAAQKIAWQTKRQRMPIGSRYQDVYGYIRIKVVAGKGRWPKEHSIVMEKRLGRSLRVGEIIHHIDGNRANNEDSNLHLCRNRSEHQAIENQLKQLFRELLAKKIVRFNPLIGAYECH
jgi:hypothetical protein